MATIRYKVDGLRELGERLSRLREDVAKKIAPASTSAGARVVKKRAIQNLEQSPAVESGLLKENVIIKKLGKRDTTLTAEHIVTVRKKSYPEGKGRTTRRAAMFVEFGTVEMPAEPFLRPAINEGHGEALDAIVKTLRRRIERAEKGK
jgi:HK97 gp10 family phage protein